MLHLWSLELCSTKLYSSKKVYKSLVPEKLSSTKDIVTLGNFVWLLKTMKQEHEQHELENLLAQNDSQRTSLSNLVDFDIQKPSKGAGYGILLPKEKNADEIDLKHTAK